MTIPDILQSLAGKYVTQSVIHAIIAVVVTDGALRAWKIDNPAVKQRFRVLTVLFPIFSFPCYQLINPDRGSLLFRSGALFDSGRWMAMQLFGVVPVHFFFLFLLAGTALVFLFQELLPILRHLRESDTDVAEVCDPTERAMLDEVLASLPMDSPRTVIIDDDELVIFSSTGKQAAVYVSTGLLKALDREQLRAALAHEIAHIMRSRRPLLLATFLLRMLVFFNPTVLVEFRRAVRNEEKICDDIAVSATGRPDALAETLKKFYSNPRRAPDASKPLPPADVSFEEYSHDLQLESRIARLEKTGPPGKRGWWFPFAIVLFVISGVCYFVV
jgi:Zn-dependent protease with chaperone function